MKESFSPHPYLCSQLVSITSNLSHSDAETVTGNLEAIGECSALVLSDVPVNRGIDVTISTKVHSLKGVVERCDFDELLGYYLEISLSPESRWSQRWFKPKHLFALRALKERAAKKCA